MSTARIAPRIALALFLGALAACNRAPEPPPAPLPISAEATGYFCGMNLAEHQGPKGQIFLASALLPLWFSSAKDAIAFTMLADAPRDIRAIYVSDMGRAPSFDDPGDRNWTDARTAWFVIESRIAGGMGSDETIPFADKNAAARFAAEHSGRVVGFADVPRAYVLGPEADTAEPQEGTSG